MADPAVPPVGEWELAVINGTQQTPIPQWDSGSYTQSLYGQDTLGFFVDGTMIEAGLIVKRSSDLLVTRRFKGVLTRLGRVRCTIRRNGRTADQHRVEVGGVDFRGVLHGRILHEQRTYTQVAQSAIVADLIAYTQAKTHGDYGLVVPTALGTPHPLRDRTYDGGANIGTLIDQLSAVIDGFDWWTDVDRNVWMQAPRRAQDKTSTVIEVGATASQLDDDEDDEYANVVRVNGTNTIPAFEDLASATQGRWERNISDPDLKEQATVDGRAAREASISAAQRRAFTFTISPGEWGSSVFLVPGDIHRVRDSRPVQGKIDTTARVQEVRYTFDGTTEAIVCTSLEEVG